MYQIKYKLMERKFQDKIIGVGHKSVIDINLVEPSCQVVLHIAILYWSVSILNQLFHGWLLKVDNVFNISYR